MKLSKIVGLLIVFVVELLAVIVGSKITEETNKMEWSRILELFLFISLITIGLYLIWSGMAAITALIKKAILKNNYKKEIEEIKKQNLTKTEEIKNAFQRTIDNLTSRLYDKEKELKELINKSTTNQE